MLSLPAGKSGFSSASGALIFLILIHLFTACRQEIQPSVIIHHANVWSGVEGAPFYKAIAIAGDSILAVGDSEELLEMAGDGTRLIDAGGKLVMAGFNDAHIHFLGGSVGLTQVELSSTTSAREVTDQTNRFILDNPNAKWITGRGWQYTFYPGGLPSHETMAGIKTDKPLFIRAYDGHSAYANRQALALAGIRKGTRFDGFGEIVFDRFGEPTGVLKESAMDLVRSLIPPLTREDNLAALRKGLRLAASLGITSAQNASGSPEELSLYLELLRSGELTMRYAAAFGVDETTTEADLARYSFLKDSIGSGNTMLRADAIKFMIDGVIESHTGAMIGKYDDLKETDPLATGQVSMPIPDFERLVAELDRRKFRIYTHAIGDLGVRRTLDAYEKAMEANGVRDARHRVEHIETISDADLPRFATLGVMPSMEPIHADPATISVWETAIGKARIGNSFAWASMLKNKAKLVYSSDWPACISLDPIRGIHVAVNRRTPSGFPEGGWIPEQRISMAEALKAYTSMGAYSSFEEGIKGTLEAGKLADVIMLSQDLFTIDPMKTADTRVLLTIVNGQVVFERNP
ncbi:MAG: amidohydrolase [Bacteroidota bacterium]